MRYIFIIPIIALLFSCDKRKDLYENSNGASQVNIVLENSSSNFSATINGNSITDTMKLGQPYLFSLSVSDESGFIDLEFSGDDSMKVDGEFFTSTTISRNDIHNFEFIPSSIGDKYFSLKFTDVYGVETTYSFHIVVFKNRTPTISWELFNINQLSPLEKSIVVFGQDGDEYYGGKIIYYQFVIDSDTTFMTNNQLNYVFPSTGNYFISVKCMDSDLEWSNEISISDYAITN